MNVDTMKGEDVEISEPDRARAMLCQEMEQEDDTHLWHNYLMVRLLASHYVMEFIC